MHQVIEDILCRVRDYAEQTRQSAGIAGQSLHKLGIISLFEMSPSADDNRGGEDGWTVSLNNISDVAEQRE